MKIHILFFAALCDAAGVREVDLEISGSTVGDALEEIRVRFPGVVPLLDRVQAAVNEEYAKPDTLLCEGDRVALIPPVSGGAQ